MFAHRCPVHRQPVCEEQNGKHVEGSAGRLEAHRRERQEHKGHSSKGMIIDCISIESTFIIIICVSTV